ncbi:hypothetical protein PWG14_19460 (plasmid) [Chromobacterium amazonense]|nr:hypothetical protein [Chromobacterium amazonense]MDE1714674.1 hypothetical protein [Chromobacterium amazonense]
MMIHAADEASFEDAARRVRAAIRIDEIAPAALPQVYQIIRGE